jgi:hypothetical protein
VRAPGKCSACGEAFEQNARGRLAQYCKRPECLLARGKRAPASEAVRGRPPAVSISAPLADAAKRALLGDEQRFFARLQALKHALAAGEHAASRDALLDLIASAGCWAAAINPNAGQESQVPGPQWPVAKAAPVVTAQRIPASEQVQLAPVRTHPGAAATDRYVEALAARAGDLDTEQALDRPERILGLGR